MQSLVWQPDVDVFSFLEANINPHTIRLRVCPNILERVAKRLPACDGGRLFGDAEMGPWDTMLKFEEQFEEQFNALFFHDQNKRI